LRGDCLTISICCLIISAFPFSDTILSLPRGKRKGDDRAREVTGLAQSKLQRRRNAQIVLSILTLMNGHITWIPIVVIASSNLWAQAVSQPKESGPDPANRLFQLGKFAEAGELYSRIAAQDPNDYSAPLQLGRIALLSNRLDDAQK
jgi:hypothetical protein